MKFDFLTIEGNIGSGKTSLSKKIASDFNGKLILEEFANLCRSEDLGRIAMKDSIYNLEGFDSMAANHHIGGTRMGVSKLDSVVNIDLNVHNINNLYVSGSSNFVTSGYRNPTFTIVNFAIRLAEKLNERLRSA